MPGDARRATLTARCGQSAGVRPVPPHLAPQAAETGAVFGLHNDIGMCGVALDHGAALAAAHGVLEDGVAGLQQAAQPGPRGGDTASIRAADRALVSSSSRSSSMADILASTRRAVRVATDRTSRSVGGGRRW